MKHLVIIRHGSYGDDHRLSAEGKKQIASIALHLSKSISGANSVILTSPAPRALDTADIIQQSLGIKNYVEIPFFWSDRTAPAPTYYKDPNPLKVMDIIQQYENNETVIVVSHFELVNQFPNFFARNTLGKDWNLPELEKGQAIDIDIEKKTFKVLKHIDHNLLDSKLNLLHHLLVITTPRPSLPDELSGYRDAFQEFLEETSTCTDSLDKVYIQALANFRDTLLAER